MLNNSLCNTQVIQLIWRDLHFWGQKCKANGAYDTVNLLPIISPNVHQFKKILSPAD